MVESSPAMGACWRREGFDLQTDFADLKTEGEFDKGFDPFQGKGSPWAQEAVVAHLHESCGQYVLKKATHKFPDVQAHGAPAIGFGLFVSEKYLVVLDFNDSAV